MVSTSHDIDMTSASNDRLMVLSGDDEAKEDCASELSISNIVICDTNNDVIVTNIDFVEPEMAQKHGSETEKSGLIDLRSSSSGSSSDVETSVDNNQMPPSSSSKPIDQQNSTGLSYKRGAVQLREAGVQVESIVQKSVVVLGVQTSVASFQPSKEAQASAAVQPPAAVQSSAVIEPSAVFQPSAAVQPSAVIEPSVAVQPSSAAYLEEHVPIRRISIPKVSISIPISVSLSIYI